MRCGNLYKGLVLALIPGVLLGQAIVPPSQPIPRIAVEAHVGFITKIDVDSSGRYVLTVSEDKTARIWDAEQRRLYKTLRIPVATGYEGRLYVGAISGDGKYAAVGGYTGINGRSGSSVYYVELNSDRYFTIDNTVPAPIDNLQFSPDGRYLAIAYAARSGLRVVDLRQNEVLNLIPRGNDRILGMDFSRENSLVVSSIDGTVKKFGGRRFSLLAERTLLSGIEPMHVRFSPSGTQIALGYAASPRISILNASSLREEILLDAKHLNGQVGLIAAEWSTDGRYVFGGGRTEGNIETPLLRWDMSNPTEPETLLMAPKRIGDIHRVADGKIIYASGMPTIGLATDDGELLWHVDAVTADLRSADPGAFLVSADGLSVQFPFDRRAGRIGSFSPLTIDPTVSLVGSSRLTRPTNPAISEAPGWSVSIDAETFEANINGVELTLEARESPRTFAFSPDHDAVYLGTAWFLRAFNKGVTQSWQTELTGEVQLLNASTDGRWVIAALSDGTIRWFRSTDGREVLALFPHVNGRDWIAWIPDGYYMSSLYGDELIGWHINRGWTEKPDFYKAVQFERILYRPDVVKAYVQSYGDPASIDAILGADSFSIADLDTIAPPDVSAVASTDANTGMTTLSVTASTRNLPLQEISVFVDGIPVTAGDDRQVPPDSTDSLNVTIPLPAGVGENKVRVEVSHGRALGIEELWVDNQSSVSPAKGKLYVLAIGVSEFADDDIPDLRFAAKDASDVALTFAGMRRSAYEEIHTHLVADDALVKPTRKQILGAFEFLTRAGPTDTVVLFFASHGLTVNGEYFFAPHDARIDAPASRRATLDDLDLSTFLRWEEIFEPMRLAAGRRLMIVDTCASADISGPIDLFNLQKRSASSQIAFMTASAGNQLSQELRRKEQGLFTFALLTALRDRFDPNRDGIVSLLEVYELSRRMVPNWRENKRLEQTPQLMAPDFLAPMPLAISDAAMQGGIR